MRLIDVLKESESERKKNDRIKSNLLQHYINKNIHDEETSKDYMPNKIINNNSSSTSKVMNKQNTNP